VVARVGVVIQAFAAGDPAIANAREGGAAAVLLDASEPGSGKAFDWALAEGMRSTRVIVAGGLTDENVGAAIARLRPWGVDVSSGVETTPGSGRKDPPRLRRFIAEARRAGEELQADGWVPHPEDGLPAYDWEADAALRRP
jgi:phosphoribosylanthranilate isomerase